MIIMASRSASATQPAVRVRAAAPMRRALVRVGASSSSSPKRESIHHHEKHHDEEDEEEQQASSDFKCRSASLTLLRGPLLMSLSDLNARLDEIKSGGNNTMLPGEEEESEDIYTMYVFARFLGLMETLKQTMPLEREFFTTSHDNRTSMRLLSLFEKIGLVLASVEIKSDEEMTINDAAAEEELNESTERITRTPPPPHPPPHSATVAEAVEAAWEKGSSTEVQAHLHDVFEHPPSAGGDDSNRIIGSSASANVTTHNLHEEAITATTLLRIDYTTQHFIGASMRVLFDKDVHATAIVLQPDLRDFLGDPDNCEWLRDLCCDVRTLVESCHDAAAADGRNWSRVLAFQKLIVQVIDLLDPQCIVISKSRRSVKHLL